MATSIKDALVSANIVSVEQAKAGTVVALPTPKAPRKRAVRTDTQIKAAAEKRTKTQAQAALKLLPDAAFNVERTTSDIVALIQLAGGNQTEVRFAFMTGSMAHRLNPKATKLDAKMREAAIVALKSKVRTDAVAGKRKTGAAFMDGKSRVRSDIEERAYRAANRQFGRLLEASNVASTETRGRKKGTVITPKGAAPATPNKAAAGAPKSDIAAQTNPMPLVVACDTLGQVMERCQALLLAAVQTMNKNAGKIVGEDATQLRAAITKAHGAVQGLITKAKNA